MTGSRSRCSPITVKKYAFSLSCARNIAVTPIKPPKTRNALGSNPAMFMLDTACEGRKAIAKALKHRFDKLPIHKICYGQSCNPPEFVLDKLERAIDPEGVRWFVRPCNNSKTYETGNRRDMLGMTPLHILACSTKHDLRVYQLVIKKYPENLTTRDECGHLPILYAFWSNAHLEVLHLLIERQLKLFPNHEIDWAGMVETMGRAPYLPGSASASLVCIKNVLHAQQTSFPNHHVDWQRVVFEW
eukprot:CAMPEP_0172531018 /NCGR_PEP_ID=MMETSP1067-20121228/4581_1 /TAXON_ID=265564 ORGANISM="Thalassiosira punctigera, Strain Tpunct2005C2" /NCGR_SAMPLE_ID=MMETSP1067 /ASSEMBLY_ACC=CAM_ASM_000444 /LENGTH=243 /DNA_ID=CAMNT_0013315341 /DNA_START=178 /DNA_END=906 /DNA_ORIENTATION=-